jgi:hypothetical protein
VTLCVLGHKPEGDGTVKPRRSAPGLMICSGHLEQIRHMLVGGTHKTTDGTTVITRGLVELDGELAESHSPRGPAPEKTKRSKADGENAPVPARSAVTQIRYEIAQRTHSWARMIAADRDLAAWRHSPLDATCAFLEAHTEWLSAQVIAKGRLGAGHPVIDVFHGEIGHLHRSAMNAIDPTHKPRAIPLPAARCLEPDCLGILTGLIRGNEATPQDAVICCSADPAHNQPVRRYLAFAERREAS